MIDWIIGWTFTVTFMLHKCKLEKEPIKYGLLIQSIFIWLVILGVYAAHIVDAMEKDK